MHFDFEAETNLLRTRSAFTPRVKATLLVAALLSLIVFGMAIFAPDPQIRENPSQLLAFGTAIFTIGGLIALLIFTHSKRLIQSGIVLRANIQSVMRLPKNVSRIAVSYHIDDRFYDKAFLVPSVNCRAVECAGFVLLAVLPDNPSVAEPLYNFADPEDRLDVMTGKRGLVEIEAV
ncbi:MAG: hypothetical protein KDA88_07890 [Planctomycetaceae bacterium]|nr:hypothetical protein [Planctomycetaceae bacterium]MCB9953797.1 hypothetical protein [Planctomycetaceae bacterium]